MKNTTLKHKIAQGFSLVELLVVIAVIGVIAAIAIPNIGGVNDAAKKSAAQRNAQSIASIMSNAKAAGMSASTTLAAFKTSGYTVTDTSSPFTGQTFSMPSMPAKALTDAEQFLDDNGAYDSSAAFTPTP